MSRFQKSLDKILSKFIHSYIALPTAFLAYDFTINAFFGHGFSSRIHESLGERRKQKFRDTQRDDSRT